MSSGSKKPLMGCCTKCIDDLLNRAFFKLGYVVAKNPGYFLIVPVLLTLLCITGFQRINYSIDPEYLFSPVNGEGKSERASVEAYFKVNYSSKFNVGRITRAGRFGRVIVTAKDGDPNILRPEVWKELRLLDGMIQNATVHYDDETFTYKDICARWMGDCFENDILNLDHILEEVQSGELNLTFPLMFNPVTWDAHAFPVYFGGSVVVDGIILSVPSVQLIYFGNADNHKLDTRGAKWEDAFLDVVGNAQDNGLFKHITVARFASRTLDHELEKNTKTVLPYFASTFIIMALFSIVTCMMSDWVRSKPVLGLLGNFSAAMATLASFGFCMYLGVDFIGINLAAPFLMIGIGIDDTFVMLAAWRRTSIKDSVPQRMAVMLSEAAVSITITSVTDMISFWIGVFSPFPSVRIFCIYSGFAVMFIFAWHLTFFSACVALSGYAEQKNLHAILCCKVLPKSKAKHRSWFYRVFMTGGVSPDDPDNPEDNREHMMMVFFREYFAPFLNFSIVKIIVILVFCFYLLGAGYGFTQIKEGLERRKVAKKDSYSVTFFDREDDYFREFPYRIQVLLTGDMNFSDPVVQAQVENLTQVFENTSYISGPLYTESWLRSFVQYIERNDDYLNVTLDTEEDFLATLKELWLFPQNPFSLDVKFNEAGDKIIASRFLIQAVNISGTNHEKEMVRALRKICAESPLNVTVFHPYFIFFDQFELVRPLSIQNMVVGAFVMMCVSFLFIPNFSCSLWVAFSIVSIEIGVVGYMAMWDVNLDSISMINLIMCIGYSVDFTAHLCYAYMSSKAKHPDNKVKDCLYALGLPIFQGAISTILGMFALALSDTYLFLVFFKMVFLVTLFGAMHGLFLLPVLLSLFGPGSCSRIDDEDNMKMSSVEKAFPHPYCIPHPTFTMNGSNLSQKPFKQVYKAYGDMDKDLGLGTSGEDSSESTSSGRSNKKPELEEEQTEKRWRRVSQGAIPSSQFTAGQVPQILDVYGHDTERAWHRQRHEDQRHRRRYSPPENRYYGPPPVARSSSYHNLHQPRYIAELRFP